MLGMLSPSYRGALVTSGLFLYVFMGLVAGYYGGRLYKTLRGMFWKKAAFYTAIFYPFVVFSVCFLLNFFIWGKIWLYNVLSNQIKSKKNFFSSL